MASSNRWVPVSSVGTGRAVEVSQVLASLTDTTGPA
jgi:hypothetical protein